MTDDLPVYTVDRDGDPKEEGLRVATMHRAKGLEYGYIVVAGADSTLLSEHNAS